MLKYIPQTKTTGDMYFNWETQPLVKFNGNYAIFAYCHKHK